MYMYDNIHTSTIWEWPFDIEGDETRHYRLQNFQCSPLQHTATHPAPHSDTPHLNASNHLLVH